MNQPLSQRATLSEAQFAKLRDLIYQVSGIHFAPNKKYLLESRLQSRLEARKLKNFDEYHLFLKFDPRRQEELTFLFNEITTNETSFFRNMPQITAFEREVLPALIESKRQGGLRRLRIWSAACSSGEEPYTLAIVLREVLKDDIKNWSVEVVANDISTEMLQKAEEAVYGDYAMRATPLLVKQRYFDKQPDGQFKLKPEARKLVRFMYLNFSDAPKMKAMNGFDVVFCRNVLIYFDDEAKKRFVQHFYDALVPGGYFFIGHSESLHNISRAFKTVHYNQALAYKKEP